jgi:[acyl-carrier-protein] S-malonyltransferase
MLPVSAPFHSSLLKPAADRLAERLAATTFAAPRIPVLHNVDVRSYDEADAIRDALARQAANPVRWTETVQALKARGVTHVVECGPGRVLSGLVGRIDDSIDALSLSSGSMLEQVKSTLGASGG